MDADSYPAEPLMAVPNLLYEALATLVPQGSLTLLLTYMLLALVISSICSVLESTLLSTPLSFVNTLEQQGVKGFERLKRLKTDIDRPISAILVVNTIANTVGASLVGSEAARLYDSTGVGVVSE